MAKRKTKTATKGVTGQTSLSIKMTVPFREWLESVADADRSMPTQVLEKGAVLYAQSIGISDAAPMRRGGR